MQFQADILETVVQRPEVIESTALGAAYLAGLSVGFWSKEELSHKNPVEREFNPAKSPEEVAQLYKGWKRAIKRTLNWLKD